MDQPTSTELVSMNQHKSIRLTVDTVKQTHQQLIDRNMNLSAHTQQIIDILGGIDNVLQISLTKALTSEQLHQINNIITSIHDQHQGVVDDMMTVDDYADNGEIIGDVLVSASLTNTYLHRIFNRDLASKIIRLIYGRIMLGIVISVLLTLTAYSLIPNIWPNYVTFPLFTFCMVFGILILFSLNATITKQILKTFEFWFKLIYWIRAYVCYVFYHDENTLYMHIICITATIAVFIFCLVDGLHLSFRFKASVMVFGSLCFSILSFFWTVYSFDDECNVSIINVSGVTLNMNLYALAASAMRVVSIFFWKQTILAIIKPNKSTMVKESVKIIWLP